MAYGINVRLIYSLIGRSHYLVETIAFPGVWIFHLDERSSEGILLIGLS